MCLIGLIVASVSACLGGEPEVIKVDVALKREHVALPRSGDPPTLSTVMISRVIDPKTGRPYDRSNSVLGVDLGHLRRTFRLEASEALLGEPVLVEFRIELDGPGRWDEPVGGFSRGLGRDGRFFFVMRHKDGAWVPDIFEGHDTASFGGPGGLARVERGQPEASWHAVQAWCAIDRAGVYDLYAFHWGGAFPEDETRAPGFVGASRRP